MEKWIKVKKSEQIHTQKTINNLGKERKDMGELMSGRRGNMKERMD